MSEDHGPEAPAALVGGQPPRKGPLLMLVRDQRVAFLLVGGINTAIGYSLFLLFDVSVGAVVRPHLGAAATADVVLLCAHVCSVLIAFVLYRRFVFRVRGHVLRDLARFESVYLVSIGVNLVLLPLLITVTHWPSWLAQGIILVLTTTVSYFGHREFSFRRAAGETPDAERD